MRDQVLTYEKCQELLGTRDSCKLMHNTILCKAEFEGEVEYHVVLYATIVVKILPDGSYVLNSGDHRTRTTMNRINHYSPVKVYSEKGVWMFFDGEEFRDGVNVYARGNEEGEVCE